MWDLLFAFFIVGDDFVVYWGRRGSDRDFVIYCFDCVNRDFFLFKVVLFLFVEVFMKKIIVYFYLVIKGRLIVKDVDIWVSVML